MGVRSDEIPGPRPKNPDGLNLGIYVFEYVYKVHMCMYVYARQDENLD